MHAFAADYRPVKRVKPTRGTYIDPPTKTMNDAVCDAPNQWSVLGEVESAYMRSLGMGVRAVGEI